MYCILFVVGLVIALLFTSLLLYTKIKCGYNQCSRHLIGKVVIVTGSNAGIGYETAKDLADRGARVILACRNEQRGLAAKASIVAATGNTDVHYRNLNLASFSSVRKFADDILKNEKKLDILINNAGMAGTGYQQTEDGLLLDMQSNHFGPFLLTCLLLPLLKSSAPSRIINVSSEGHRFAKLDLNNLNLSKETYNNFTAYFNTKLCNVLMTTELARRLKGTNVMTNSLHPGGVNTDIIDSIAVMKFFRPILKIFFKTPWEGAQTPIYLAVSSELEGVSGYYYEECRQTRTSRRGQDVELAGKLWEASEKIVKLN